MTPFQGQKHGFESRWGRPKPARFLLVHRFADLRVREHHHRHIIIIIRMRFRQSSTRNGNEEIGSLNPMQFEPLICALNANPLTCFDSFPESAAKRYSLQDCPKSAGGGEKEWSPNRVQSP